MTATADAVKQSDKSDKVTAKTAGPESSPKKDGAALKPSPSVVTFDIPIEQIKSTELNARKEFSNAELLEMAESLKSRGQLQELIVRPVPGRVPFELIAGERRFRAAQLPQAGPFKTLRAYVREGEDAVAAMIDGLMENLQRVDLKPMEEARGIKALMVEADLDQKAVAGKLKRSEAHVSQRLALLDLPKDVAKAVQAGHITAEHAAIIGRLPKVFQTRALRVCNEEIWMDDEDGEGESVEAVAVVPVADFKAWIQRALFRNLSAAPWDLADKALCPKAGACMECPHNSLNAPLLAEVKGSTCQRGDCYDEKMDAHLKSSIKNRRDTGQEVYTLSSERHSCAGRPGGDGKKEPMTRQLWEESKAKDAAVGILVDGPMKGKQINFKLTEEAPKAARLEVAKTTGDEKEQKKLEAPVKPMKERRALLASRRVAFIYDHLRTKIVPKTEFAQFLKVHGREWNWRLIALAAVMGAEDVFGYVSMERKWVLTHEFFKQDPHKAGERLWARVRKVLENQLSYGNVTGLTADKAKHTAELIGADWPALEAQAEKELPEPKSWTADAKPAVAKPNDKDALASKSKPVAPKKVGKPSNAGKVKSSAKKTKPKAKKK